MGPQRMRQLRVSLIGLVVLGFISGTAAHASTRYFDVTIINITANQVFTPLLVATHKAGVKLFSLGRSASEALDSKALEMLAEGGDTAPLKDMLDASPKVLDVQIADGPLSPGGSITIHVRTRGRFKYVSVAGMLVPTNDAFVALNGVRGPRHGSVSFNALAYDAGTEANDESCDNIPGPPDVCGGEGFNAENPDAEGFVHIHRGIHGGVDLDAAMYDWRNPVARITIRRR